MPRESKKKTPKKKTKEKSTKESETPKMDEDEINRLMQNAFDQANARAEQKFEERLTALSARACSRSLSLITWILSLSYIL